MKLIEQGCTSDLVANSINRLSSRFVIKSSTGTIQSHRHNNWNLKPGLKSQAERQIKD